MLKLRMKTRSSKGEKTLSESHSLHTKSAVKSNRMDLAKVIEIRDLYKSFDSLEVLKGISLDAHEGDVVAIIGGSGSGKSTLLRCINMLETPTRGTITVHGELIEMKSDGKGGQLPANKGSDPAYKNTAGDGIPEFQSLAAPDPFGECH